MEKNRDSPPPTTIATELMGVHEVEEFSCLATTKFVKNTIAEVRIDGTGHLLCTTLRLERGANTIHHVNWLAVKHKHRRMCLSRHTSCYETLHNLHTSFVLLAMTAPLKTRPMVRDNCL